MRMTRSTAASTVGHLSSLCLRLHCQPSQLTLSPPLACRARSASASTVGHSSYQSSGATVVGGGNNKRELGDGNSAGEIGDGDGDGEMEIGGEGGELAKDIGGSSEQERRGKSDQEHCATVASSIFPLNSITHRWRRQRGAEDGNSRGQSQRTEAEGGEDGSGQGRRPHRRCAPPPPPPSVTRACRPRPPELTPPLSPTSRARSTSTSTTSHLSSLRLRRYPPERVPPPLPAI